MQVEKQTSMSLSWAKLSRFNRFNFFPFSLQLTHFKPDCSGITLNRWIEIEEKKSSKINKLIIDWWQVFRQQAARAKPKKNNQTDISTKPAVHSTINRRKNVSFPTWDRISTTCDDVWLWSLGARTTTFQQTAAAAGLQRWRTGLQFLHSFKKIQKKRTHYW